MPRDIVTTVFAFAELSESAQTHAVESVAAMLDQNWGDSFDIESITNTIIYALAAELKTPGWDTYGEGDFPGIDGVSLKGWDLDRGSYLALSGTLTDENAPALPWTNEIESVTLEARRDHTSIWFVIADDTDANTGAMRDVITNAMTAALTAGRAELEYITGDEHAREWIDANEPEFTVDGELP